MDMRREQDRLIPDLIERQRGGWLAVSGRGAPVRLGAVGATVQEAREQFERLVGQWAAAKQADLAGEEPAH